MGKKINKAIVLERAHECLEKEGKINSKLMRKYSISIKTVNKYVGNMSDLYNELNYKVPPKFYLPKKEELIDDILKIFNDKSLFNKNEYRLKGAFSLRAIEIYFGSWSQMLSELGIVRSSQDSWLNYFEKFFGVHLEREKSFDTCRNPQTGRLFRFDGYSLEYNFLIEYQDVSHFMEIKKFCSENSNLKTRQIHDQLKMKWAEENNIPLYIICYNEDPFSFKYMCSKFPFLTPVKSATTLNYKSSYWGVRKENNSYIARITINGKCKSIFQSQDILKCALYREGYLKTKKFQCRLNNLTIDQLSLYGLHDWSEYENLKKSINHYESPYIGVNKTKYGWRSVIKIDGKTKYLMEITYDDPKICALYRFGYIKDHLLNNNTENFNDFDYQEYGLIGWFEYAKLKVICKLRYRQIEKSLDRWKNNKFIGVTYRKIKLHRTGKVQFYYIATVNNKSIIQRKDPLKCALYRTGYIKVNNLTNIFDDFPDFYYFKYGLNSYLDFEKLRDL